MNESVIRSPKWLRNFVDFEVNTGEDIKGEPSKKRQKKIDEEKKKKEDAERERRRKFREEEAKAEEERKKREEKEDSDKFDELFLMIIRYIKGNYKDCKISIPSDNYLTIESPDGIGVKGTDVIFKVTLNNTVGRPTFSVYIKYGKKEYSYNVSGIAAIYLEFKMFILTDVYQYYKSGGYSSGSKSSSSGSKSSSSGSKSSSSGSGSKSSGKYDYDSDYWKNPPKSEDPERENKRRRYNLLKDTKAGYKRQMDKILEWEKKNPGQKHPDNKHIVKNQLDAVQSKIDLMNSLYHFESHHYSNVSPYEIY